MEKSKKIRRLLTNLPYGVTYIGDPADYNEERLCLLARKREQELNGVANELIKLKPYTS